MESLLHIQKNNICEPFHFLLEAHEWNQKQRVGVLSQNHNRMRMKNWPNNSSHIVIKVLNSQILWSSEAIPKFVLHALAVAAESNVRFCPNTTHAQSSNEAKKNPSETMEEIKKCYTLESMLITRNFSFRVLQVVSLAISWQKLNPYGGGDNSKVSMETRVTQKKKEREKEKFWGFCLSCVKHTMLVSDMEYQVTHAWE